MGRPPNGGGPAFRFTQAEVIEMEARLQEVNNAVPPREIINSLADGFSASAERAGKSIVQPKQVWNWFQNRRYAQRAKLGKSPGKLNVSSMPRDESLQFRNVAVPVAPPTGRNLLDVAQVEFEAKSARDGAWYDISVFLSHRMSEAGDPEVRVQFSGFGMEEDEWVDVRKCVRLRSLPCEAAECIAVLPGDLILCFQEGKEQALYFDAHVLDAQRRRHDVRGCRCRFLVRYDHDQSEEIVPLRKVCRRPETDYRLQLFQGSKVSGSMELRLPKDPLQPSSSKDLATQRPSKHRKLTDVNADETSALPHTKETINLQSLSQALPAENNISVVSDVAMVNTVANTESTDDPQEVNRTSG